MVSMALLLVLRCPLEVLIWVEDIVEWGAWVGQHMC